MSLLGKFEYAYNFDIMQQILTHLFLLLLLLFRARLPTLRS